MVRRSAGWLLVNVLLASVVTPTNQSARNAEEEIPWGPQARQESEFASNDTATSATASDNRTNLDTADMYLQQNLSDNHVTYIIEHRNLPDEAGLAAADIQETDMIVANESVTFRRILKEDLLDRVEKFKSVVILLGTQNNFTKYTVQTETSKNVSNVFVETAGSPPLDIVLILLNDTTNPTQDVKTLLNNLNVTLNSPTRRNHIVDQAIAFIPNETKSTVIDRKPGLLWKNSKEYRILTVYIDPAMYVLILAVGLLGNGMLLFIFVRHREMRTTANLTIIHLAMCDIINLSINAPLHFYFRYEGGSSQSIISCRIVLAVRQFLRCAGALAVIALIIQRFSIIVPAFTQSSPHCTPLRFAILSIIAVWVLPVLIALPSMYVPTFYEPICHFDKADNSVSFVIVFNSVLYCLVMPSLMFGFSSLTARRLSRSVRDIPGELRHQMQEQSRIRSARVVMALAVVFVITYFPFYIWVLLARWVGVDKNSPFMIYALHITKQLLFANGCFNPISMFVASTQLRKLLARHVRYSPEREVYNTRL